jgi:hypothetical protein
VPTAALLQGEPLFRCQGVEIFFGKKDAGRPIRAKDCLFRLIFKISAKTYPFHPNSVSGMPFYDLHWPLFLKNKFFYPLPSSTIKRGYKSVSPLRNQGDRIRAQGNFSRPELLTCAKIFETCSLNAAGFVF